MRQEHIRNAITLTLAMMLTLGSAGCRTANQKLPTQSPDTFCKAPDGVVTLSPGDELDIKFYYAPELNENQTIRPDGNITLQLVGDVQAAGRTPTGLEKHIRAELKTLIDNSEVTIIVRRLCQRGVYVGGAVLRPRSVAMPGQLTALAAIMEAGGIDYRSATPKEVLILRESNGNYQTYQINLKDRLSGKTKTPVYLHPKDIVYVSRSRIVNANRWIDQHINRMVPQFGLTISHRSGNTVTGIDTSR